MPSDPTKRTTDDQEFLMDTQDIVEAWRREAVQEGVTQGITQGAKRSLIDIYEARLGAMPEDVRLAIDDAEDEARLRSWLLLAATRAADEVAAVIRASHAS
jgi:hypothetical protein